jgi:hypothetical protein
MPGERSRTNPSRQIKARRIKIKGDIRTLIGAIAVAMDEHIYYTDLTSHPR